LECDTDVYKTQEDVSLFNAAKTGDMYNVKLALEEKANINASDRLGQSALMWTGWNGHSEIIKYLVHYNDEQLKLKKKGKNKKYVPLKYKKISQEKYNALFCLIMSNSIQKKEALECMKLLLEKEPSLLAITDKYNENCLHKAVRSGNKEYLEFFLKELKKRKINCIAVCPGPMDTEFLGIAGIEKGVSRTFDTLPRVNATNVAGKSLKASKRGKSVYTNRFIYKLYRVLAKLLPHSFMMELSAV
jgi:hypothetical protein